MAGVVAALRAEACTLGSPRRRGDGLLVLHDGTLVAVSGMGCAAAAAAAAALVGAGATALVSWGLAGGLDPRLTAGTICLPTAVVTGDGRAYATDHHWRELVGAAIAGRRSVVAGTLLTSLTALADVAGKAAAFRDTGAAAVDMESVAIAEVAAAHGVPFIAVRVIVDTAADALPAVVMSATRGGQVGTLRLVRALLRHPLDLKPLLRIAQRYRSAQRALADVASTGALAPLAYAIASPTRVA